MGYDKNYKKSVLPLTLEIGLWPSTEIILKRYI